MIATTPTNSVTALQSKVMLVLPWLKHTNPMTAFCVAQLMDKRRTASMLNFGDAFVAHSRNKCADHFLKSNLDWMLTIDDDMILPFGNAKWFNAHTGFNVPEPFASFNTIDRLLSHGKTLVGALYFGRNPGGSKPVYNEGCTHPDHDADCRRSPREELRPTKWVGTGCLLIHRSVFESIEKKFPLLARGPDGMGGNWFTSTEHSAMDSIDRAVKQLTSGPMTGESAALALSTLAAAQSNARNASCLGMGEDVAFCTRAAAAGHQPYVDFGLVAGHLGHHVYGPKDKNL
jgi:hypothetical protein